MLTIDLQGDFFTLFGLKKIFHLNRDALDKSYLALQSQYHPDRATHLDSVAKHQHLSAATHINMAYQTLKFSLTRARYLLQLAGIDTEEESNTAMPADFLMAQMQWHEDIQSAKISQNVDELEKLHQLLQDDMDALDETLGWVLDHQHDAIQAAKLVRQYCFYEKLDEEIGHAIESILF